MDNYLSGRWPAEMTPPPASKEKKKKKIKSGRRRVWRDIFIVLIAVVMLGGLLVGSYFGMQYAAQQMLGDLPNLPQSPLPDQTQTPGNDPSPQPTNGLTQEDLWSADMLPRAAHDPSVQLELLSREGLEPLSATEIYKKVLPSIVAVEAFNGAGYSMGSGVVVSESGYIITNYHVIEGAISLNIMLLSDRTVHEAAVVGFVLSQFLLQVSDLRGGKLLVKNNELDAVEGAKLCDLGNLARSDKGARIGLIHILNDLCKANAACRIQQALQLAKAFFQFVGGAIIGANADQKRAYRLVFHKKRPPCIIDASYCF